MLTYQHYVTPSSLPEVFSALLAHPGDSCKLIAGGTDILPWARQGRAGDVSLNALIDVSQVRELRGIEVVDGVLRVGASTPIADFIRSEELRTFASVLSRCAVWFADDQIRAQATVGGNIINASPAGDSQPALLVHNCKVVLAKQDAQGISYRTLLLADFIHGPGRTDLRPGEVLAHLELDTLKGYGVAFEKVGHRRSLVISTVCLAAAARRNPMTDKLDDFRIAIAAVGPVPVRLEAVEKALIGKSPTGKLLRDVSSQVADYVRSRSRQDYRKEVLENFVERGALRALQDAGFDVERISKES